MKKPLSPLNITASVILWRLIIFITQKLSVLIIPQRSGYLGPTSLSNFDGVHYLHIAKSGYFQFGEAFFPLYPLMIKFFSVIFPFIPPAFIGEMISLISICLALILLNKLFIKQKGQQSLWTVLFIISFPTAFFLTAVYSESLFLLLSILTLWFIKNDKWIIAGFCGALAGATRITGVFLIIFLIYEAWKLKPVKLNITQIAAIVLMPLGLLMYMYFQFVRTGDSLVFFHIQPAFGANRSGSEIILLPQVIWRYLKIIFTAYLQPTPVSYFVSLAEFIITMGSLYIIYIGWKLKIEIHYLLYSLALILLPSLTGTFSSMTRYVLAAFPLFIILGSLKNERLKIVLIMIFSIFQIIAVSLFTRGYFVG